MTYERNDYSGTGIYSYSGIRSVERTLKLTGNSKMIETTTRYVLSNLRHDKNSNVETLYKFLFYG